MLCPCVWGEFGKFIQNSRVNTFLGQRLEMENGQMDGLRPLGLPQDLGNTQVRRGFEHFHPRLPPYLTRRNPGHSFPMWQPYASQEASDAWKHSGHGGKTRAPLFSAIETKKETNAQHRGKPAGKGGQVGQGTKMYQGATHWTNVELLAIDSGGKFYSGTSP